MAVVLTEYAKIRDVSGVEREGKAVANNLVAVMDDDEIVYYGQLLGVTKVHSTVTCDNDKCENSEVGEDFKTHPKIISFDDNGDGTPDFIKTISNVVICSNYKGEKMCFCTPECSAAYFRRVVKDNVVDISSGKGTKTQFKEDPVNI